MERTKSEAVIAMRAITKVYPDGTVALREVDFEVGAGEIHGLLGENGAGKTTLTKILSGLLRPTSGEIFLNGKPVLFKSPADALKVGIGMVHQHFSLVPPFTALQNIVLGQERGRSFSPVKLKEAERKLRRVMAEGGLQVPLDVPVELLAVGIQQRIEILKLLYRDVNLLILDEPTSVLTPIEVNELFQTLRRLKEAGKTIIFITHKLKEVLEITDRISVLRGGRLMATVSTSEATPQKLATLMVGRELLPSISIERRAAPAQVLLKVEGLRVKNDLGGLAIKDLSFEVRAGEIFGIAGVEGNGQTELVEALTGLRAWEGGQVMMNSKAIKGLGPRALYQQGLGHIPEDRRRLGLVLEMNVAENGILGIQRTRQFRGPLGKLSWRKIYNYVGKVIRRFAVQTPSLKTPAKSLSGGNQQKLIIGRELSKEPRLVVAAQPTRGLDVAATRYIRDLLVQMRDAGKAILLVSADLDEIMQLSDRVGVMYEGRFVGILEAEQLEREKIGLMMGGMAVEAAQPHLA